MTVVWLAERTYSDDEDLASMIDDETRQRYAAEAKRMKKKHEPGEVV
ncbi:hypothetical protein EGH25_01645 [Haladaptatus sp. F3-133]|jgi:hypothetical protein|uniref:DUF7967 domain-containing protein n=1 Tax=Halorutilus salinus TaxID=2487751 RepID=A0A9Q4C2T3_9EURY|nr:hypothetical protein [Halorutilus salinus]MCX2818057.1 hypothetical protein [Halorutilus salinus]